MKKIISIGLCLIMLFGLSLSTYAANSKQDVNNVPVVTPRTTYDRAQRTIRAGSKWTSYQYYCGVGDYFMGCTEGFAGNGNLTITVYYASRVGGSRSYVTSATDRGYGASAGLQSSKSGYYNVVIQNNGSSSITTTCGVAVN